MRKMRWSWPDLMATPADVVRRVLHHLENERNSRPGAVGPPPERRPNHA